VAYVVEERREWAVGFERLLRRLAIEGDLDGSKLDSIRHRVRVPNDSSEYRARVSVYLLDA